MPRLCEFGEERAIDLILESGLDVTSLGPAGGFTGANGHSLRDSVLDTADTLALAGRLGAHSLTLYSGPRAGHTRNHARRLVKSALIKLADLAAEVRVDLAIRPMHPVYSRNWTFLHTVEETLELIEECDHPALKMSFGTFHLGSQYQSLLQIPRLVPRIATVQLGDGPRDPEGEWDQQPPGEGELPVTSIVQSLIDADYNGFYEIDIWSRDVWQRHYPDLLQECREQLSRSAIVRR
jgi:sugar phosphate isomerase/epimerase